MISQYGDVVKDSSDKIMLRSKIFNNLAYLVHSINGLRQDVKERFAHFPAMRAIDAGACLPLNALKEPIRLFLMDFWNNIHKSNVMMRWRLDPQRVYSVFFTIEEVLKNNWTPHFFAQAVLPNIEIITHNFEYTEAEIRQILLYAYSIIYLGERHDNAHWPQAGRPLYRALNIGFTEDYTITEFTELLSALIDFYIEQQGKIQSAALTKLFAPSHTGTLAQFVERRNDQGEYKAYECQYDIAAGMFEDGIRMGCRCQMLPDIEYKFQYSKKH